MNRVKVLALEQFSQYVRDQANKLFVTLADETFAKQIKEICTNPDLGEALAQLFKLAYGSNGKVSIEEAAKTLYDIVYGSNRTPFVHAWRDQLYTDIQSILNCKIKIIPGKYDPLADVIGRAVSKVQQEILAVLDNKLGMKFNAKSPSNPSKFHCVIPLNDQRGVPFCYMSYSGDNGKVNGEAHRQQQGSQVIKMRVLISQAVQVALRPEIDPHISGGQPMLPPDAKDVLWGMITESIDFFSDGNGVPPEHANLLQSYMTLPASSSIEKARIINHSRNEFDEAAAVAVAPFTQLQPTSPYQQAGQQFPYPPTQGQQGVQQVQPTQYQFQYQHHADLQQPAAAAAGQQFPYPLTQGQQGVRQLQPTHNQFQYQQHADLGNDPQLQVSIRRDLQARDNDFANHVSRDLNGRYGTSLPLFEDTSEILHPAPVGLAAEESPAFAQSGEEQNDQLQTQSPFDSTAAPGVAEASKIVPPAGGLAAEESLAFAQSGKEINDQLQAQSPFDSTAAPGAAGSSFCFPPPLRNEVMVTKKQEDEDKDEKLKKAKGKVANQNSSKKAKTSCASRKKKRDETDDAGTVSFLSVCTNIQYSLSILTLQTFIFLIDRHRRRENKQIRMNALDVRQVHTYVFVSANFGTLHLSPSLSCYGSIGRSLFRSIST